MQYILKIVRYPSGRASIIPLRTSNGILEVSSYSESSGICSILSSSLRCWIRSLRFLYESKARLIATRDIQEYNEPGRAYRKLPIFLKILMNASCIRSSASASFAEYLRHNARILELYRSYSSFCACLSFRAHRIANSCSVIDYITGEIDNYCVVRANLYIFFNNISSFRYRRTQMLSEVHDDSVFVDYTRKLL